MTLYNVHLYREMLLVFQDIQADSPQQAADSCRDLPAEAACGEAVDCDGETFGALVDVQGDTDYSQSVMIDFDAERIRKAAPALLKALDYLLEQTVDMDLKYGIELSEGEEEARANALAAIAQATGEPLTNACESAKSGAGEETGP
jgi:hypothetical protein